LREFEHELETATYILDIMYFSPGFIDRPTPHIDNELRVPTLVNLKGWHI
jgi:hypothetical protein